MTLNDLQSKTIMEAVSEMDLVKTHIHADEDGNVCAIELKYAPKERKAQGAKSPRKNIASSH